MIEKLEKQVKRNNKRKNINITTAVIIGFLLSSGITYGVDINNPISSDATYDTDTTLNMNGQQIIVTKQDNSPAITVSASGKKLELNHETNDTVSISTGTNRASIAATTNDINIDARKLVLNSNFTSTYPSYSIVASSKQGSNVSRKIKLTADEIEINATGLGQTHGIAAIKDDSEVEILGNLKINVESVDGGSGLQANGGNIKLKNDITVITVKNNKNRNSSGAYGIEVFLEGNMEIETKKLTLDIFSNTKSSYGIYTANGILNITTEDIDMKVSATSPVNVACSIGAVQGSQLNINNRNFLKIETVNEIAAKSIESSGRNTKAVINSKDITIDTETTEANQSSYYFAYGVSAEDNGEIDMTSNNLVINTKTQGYFGYGIFSNSFGKIDITSNNTILNTNSPSGFAIGIYSLDNGIVNINGGLEISQQGKTPLAILAGKSGLVNINQKNEAVAVKINGQMQANNNGVINLNLNGKDSFFIGKSYVDTGSKVNLGISNNAVWKNEDNSSVSNLNLDNGTIDMSYQSGGQKINIDTFFGNNGKIIMDISSADVDQTNGKTDFISIKNADREQKHLIEIGKSSIAGLLNYDFSQKILIGEASNKVRFEGSEFIENSSLYNYTLQLNRESVGSTAENNWYVAGVEKKESSTTEAVVDDISLHYMNAGLARMEADTLHKRLGDIRDLKNEAGVWSRVVSGQMEYDKNGYFKNNYTMIQAGVDKSETTSTGAWTTGFAVQRREGKTDFRNGDGKNESTGIALYKAWTGNSGNYLDLVGKYSHLKNEYKSYNAKNEKMEANYHTNVGTVSLEYGKRISKNKWYIQPHIQSTYSWIEGKNYMTSSNVRAQQKDINSLIGKAGVYAGYDFGRSSHFIKMGLLHEFMGDYGVTIKGEDTTLTKKMNGKDTWIELGVGGDIKVGKTDSTKVYYEIEKTFGGDFETNWQASLGIRHRF